MERPTRAQLKQAIDYISAELRDEAGPRHSLTEAGWVVAEVLSLRESILDIANSRYLDSHDMRESLRRLVGQPLGDAK